LFAEKTNFFSSSLSFLFNKGRIFHKGTLLFGRDSHRFQIVLSLGLLGCYEKRRNNCSPVGRVARFVLVQHTKNGKNIPK
jgi:hypothetical protein